MRDRICIVACVKHEELYIKEWIDFHIRCGIDHFFLCDNNEKDYQYPLLDVIKDYVDNGIVDILDYSDYGYVQPICYNDLFNDNRTNDYDWMLVIDIDEFICIPKYNDNIKEFLRTIPDDIDLMSFNWKYYGDNDLIEYDDRPVIERFPNPVNNTDLYDGQSLVIKSMIRTNKNFENRPIPKGINSQHALTVKLPRYDAKFRRITARTRIKFMTPIIDLSVPCKYIQELYDVFYIKHYHTKTIEEYVRFKINRGVPMPNNEDKPYYALNKFFALNEYTEEKMNKAKEIIIF